jgi:RND family efflux transporter MFP subunit
MIEKGVQADALTHTYDIRIHVANPDRRLLPGMVATVTLGQTHSPAYTRQVTLPVTSVQKSADGTFFVWVVANDSTVHRAKVTTGHTSGNRIAVTSGVAQGERVVTEGYQKLSEGTKVIF